MFERPKEVAGLLEGRAAGGDLVDKVFDADDVLLLQDALDGEVGAQRDSLSVDLTETSLVDELGDGLAGWVAESDERLDLSQQVLGSLVSSHKDCVVDLSKSEQLEDLLLSWRNSVDTLGSDDQENLGFSWNVDLALLLGSSDLVNDVLLRLGPVLGVGLASLCPISLKSSNFLSAGLTSGLQFSSPLVCSLKLLLVCLRNWSPRVTSYYSVFISSFLRFIN